MRFEPVPLFLPHSQLLRGARGERPAQPETLTIMFRADADPKVVQSDMARLNMHLSSLTGYSSQPLIIDEVHVLVPYVPGQPEQAQTSRNILMKDANVTSIIGWADQWQNPDWLATYGGKNYFSLFIHVHPMSINNASSWLQKQYPQFMNLSQIYANDRYETGITKGVINTSLWYDARVWGVVVPAGRESEYLLELHSLPEVEKVEVVPAQPAMQIMMG